MKKGDYIGVGSDGRLSLVAEVLDVQGNIIEGWVINGAWQFTLDQLTGKLYLPRAPLEKDVHSNVKVLFHGPIPKHALKDRHTMFEYMEANIKEPTVWRYAGFAWVATLTYIRRLKDALRAFQLSYRGELQLPKPRQQKEDSVDDLDIPF